MKRYLFAEEMRDNMEQLQLKINTEHRLHPMGDLYGVFFEDINHAADGGLYAELVQNRDFEFLLVDNKNYHSLTGYSVVEREAEGKAGKTAVTVETKNPPYAKNPHYAAVSVKSGIGGLKNEGYHHGIPIAAEEEYLCTIRVKREDEAEPETTKEITVALEKENGELLAKTEVAVTGDWNTCEFVLLSKVSCEKTFLCVYAEAPCTFCVDYLSLFPKHTYKNRKNGLRADLAELIADLKPRFVRFPGGCLVHDGSLNREDRDALYFWKNTIGPLSERAARKNNWGYHQTLGLGYYEYFLFCEDIGAKPLPVLPAAYNPHRREAVPISELSSWIQDALDLIEFANGDETTTWGKIRSELGHKEAFGLEYLAIGNEELFAPFLERYPYFHNAIKEKYPEIKLISSVGPFADGADFDLMWKEADKAGADLVDEHYYMAPEWMLKHIHRYDSYKRTGAKVFLGEYASLGNRYQNALCEAAYMTGLERNVDKVALACYAPLLCNVDYVNWRPDLIWFDAEKSVRTVNYHVQQMFMNHQGEYLVKSELIGGENVREPLPDIVGKVGFENENEELVVHELSVNKEVIGTNACFVGRLLQTESDVLTGLSQQELERSDLQAALTEQEISGPAKITFSFTKKKGKKQIVFLFGVGKDIYYRWEIGGWANDMSSIGIYREGRYGLLTVGNAVSVEEGSCYQGKVTIDGRHIRAELNGVVYHDFCEQETVLEPLYQSVSTEEDGRVYVKVVNVSAVEKELKMELEQEKICSDVTWCLLQSDDLAAENTLKQPETVVPTKQKLIADNNRLTVVVPAQSVSVFEWKTVK